jgi:hypothetical protein
VLLGIVSQLLLFKIEVTARVWQTLVLMHQRLVLCLSNSVTHPLHGFMIK